MNADVRSSGASAPKVTQAAAAGSRESEHPAATATKERPVAGGNGFPIVGIGASAGGLEALEVFLQSVPKNSGMAFVVVQHLAPTHKGMMVELLQRHTSMPVSQARDNAPVEPDHVYVIPPNKDMSLLHGALHLLPQPAPRGLNLPIDFFFRSLAEDRQERSIGVILSGMGTDGTLGLRAIKEKAGAAFVQSLDSAKFDGMPRSVIDAGLADVVAPAEELPGKIIAYREHTPYINRSDAALQDKALGALDKVFVLLRAQTGNDFSLYKKSTIYRRIERRMGLRQISNIHHYVRYLREDAAEIDLLFKELLIGVTSFFRDPAAWEYLKTEAMPALLATRAGGGLLRAWVPGCSTGEEAYSLAMVFKEAVEPLRPMRHITLQIFATDLDREAIEKARQAVFPDNIVADVSPERLRRFFVKDDRGYRVSKEIREMVVFAPQNIIMDPPFTKLDILCCRNLLIYLSGELQRKLIPLFHYSMNPGGVLFLGTAETVGGFSGLFSALDGRTRIYRRLDQPIAAVPIDFPSAAPPPPSIAGAEPDPVMHRLPPANIQALADRYIVQRFSPVGVLCNDKGDILYISGRVGKYLEPAVGKATLNVLAMAREGLRYELSAAFSRALREGRTITVRGISVGTNGGTQVVDLSVQRLAEPKEMRGTVMIMLADVQAPLPPAKVSKGRRTQEPARVRELEGELQRAREEIQTTREEMQTSQEELKSTNEELQSTNEELQSTNEELTTSKEEMQSLNEELQTVNHELQSKVDELSRSNNDMKNLLNSTDIATLFLDADLKVRRFTTPTAKIIKLIPGDAGRPITDIVSDLDYPDLADDAREVLRTLMFKQKQVASRDGRWFAVRIMPYRTLENVIDGIVITFTDASAFRALELSMQDQAGQLRQITDSLPVLVWGCGADGSCNYFSRPWLEYTGVPEAEQCGTRWLEQVHPDDCERARSEWKSAVLADAPFEAELRLRGERGEYRWFKLRSVPIRDPQGAVLKWYGTATDIQDVKLADEERREILESIGDAFIALDSEQVVRFANPAAKRMLGGDGAWLGKRLCDAAPQLRGSAIERKLEEVLASKMPAFFEADLDSGPNRRPIKVRVYPHDRTQRLSVLLEDG